MLKRVCEAYGSYAHLKHEKQPSNRPMKVQNTDIGLQSVTKGSVARDWQNTGTCAVYISSAAVT